jgi:transcriptional regulator with XRE-family HTH domain
MELGRALAAARNAANLTQGQVGKLIGRNQTWVSRVEVGTQRVSEEDLDRLRVILSQEDHPDLLREFVEKRPSTGTRQGSRLDAALLELRNHELTAVEISVFASERIPKSLQVSEYMLRQYRSAGTSTSDVDIPAEHSRWQRVLRRDNPPPYRVILTESALYRMPDGRLDLVKKQASHLLDLSDSFPQLHLQVLRYDAGVSHIETDMVILDFAGKRQGMVYMSSGSSTRKIGERALSDHMRRYWRTARDAALDQDQSREFVRELAQNGFGLIPEDRPHHS